MRHQRMKCQTGSTRLAIAFGLGVALFLSGCGPGPKKEETAAPQAPAPAPSAAPQTAPAPSTAAPSPVPSNSNFATAIIEPKSGSKVTGTATFTQTDGTVQVNVEIANATPGEHGIHLHEKGDCSASDASSAGGHFNPTHMPHGGPNSPEHHAGDFGNITVGPNGKGTLVLTTHDLTVAEGPLSVVGKAIVIHAGKDDLTTQPSGNSGARIACGVVD